MFFDPDTMDAQINNPGWVKALEDYINGLNVAPPGALGFSVGRHPQHLRRWFGGDELRLGRYRRQRRRR
jgi:hypothetical protein